MTWRLEYVNIKKIYIDLLHKQLNSWSIWISILLKLLGHVHLVGIVRMTWMWVNYYFHPFLTPQILPVLSSNTNDGTHHRYKSPSAKMEIDHQKSHSPNPDDLSDDHTFSIIFLLILPTFFFHILLFSPSFPSLHFFDIRLGRMKDRSLFQQIN